MALPMSPTIAYLMDRTPRASAISVCISRWKPHHCPLTRPSRGLFSPVHIRLRSAPSTIRSRPLTAVRRPRSRHHFGPARPATAPAPRHPARAREGRRSAEAAIEARRAARTTGARRAQHRPRARVVFREPLRYAFGVGSAHWPTAGAQHSFAGQDDCEGGDVQNRRESDQMI